MAVEGLKRKFNEMAYWLPDIKAELTEEEYNSFYAWLDGQTRPGNPGDQLVYIWDYEKWLSGYHRIHD